MGEHDPLSGLDSVPWSRLHGTYTTAEAFPALLRALRFGDCDERRRAGLTLNNALEHQGTRWQVSGPTVPFLIALVDDPGTPGRGWIASMVRITALGPLEDDALPFDAERVFAGARDVDDSVIEGVLDAMDREDSSSPYFDESDRAVLRWEFEAFQAAAERSDRIAAWLSDPDPYVAMQASAMVPFFAEAAGRAIGALVAISCCGRADADPDAMWSAVRTDANLALAHIPAAATDQSAINALTVMLVSSHECVRVSAAVALGYLLGSRLPDSALDVLIAAQPRIGWSVAAEHGSAWDRPLTGFAARAMHRIGL